ncbi:putative biotin-protein ligase, N terminal [Lyophyllum shimeji]|uniref:Biotin-protein ligase, N terminal n=1 Tax=Lyophyllum shimeji TaxID=47721 RepID=A0A9P3URM3_LYOSH|nr:putative biotin-protein ligase, N terminal [Lyophyllum shimeji]
MDVLIYAGPEALQDSVTNSLTTLRAILLPQYSVQTITPKGLTSQPWKAACPLFVLPQCRGRLQSASSTVIKEYVEAGGSLLSFGASAICSSSRDQDASAGILLDFFDHSTGKYVHITCGREDGPKRPCTLQTIDEELVAGIYDTEASEFRGFDGEKRSTVLANYRDADRHGVAGLKCETGAGKIAIWAPSIETPLTTESSPVPATVAVGSSVGTDEKRRLELVRKTLTVLSLGLPSSEDQPVSRPLPQFLTSHPAKPDIVSTIADLIAAPSAGSQLSVFKDDNDTFHFHHFSESADLLKKGREDTGAQGDPSKWQPKDIILCPGTLPGRDLTPLFDLAVYYETLSAARTKQGCPDAPDPWGFGEALLYGEVVTSTQTMLDKNPHLLTRLPSPFVSLASYQLAGRGRGANMWLSPSGCLQFSVLLRVPLSTFPSNKLVFVQYLFALAVVEACRDESVLGTRGEQVRLKWPNDIYAVLDGERRKIGGILVSTSFSGGNVDIVIGCGLNVLNAAPTFSLAQLLPPDQRSSLKLEKTVANILARFEKMWGTFVQERKSFDSFMNLYLERWLHSDQLVTLTTVSPHQQVRIVGITPEHGLLRTMPERRGWTSAAEGYIDLQPDGNSFDIMAGLIKSKT